MVTLVAEAVQVSVPAGTWHAGEWTVAALLGGPVALGLLLAGLCSYERRRTPVLVVALVVLLLTAGPRL